MGELTPTLAEQGQVCSKGQAPVLHSTHKYKQYLDISTKNCTGKSTGTVYRVWDNYNLQIYQSIMAVSIMSV